MADARLRRLHARAAAVTRARRRARAPARTGLRARPAARDRHRRPRPPLGPGHGHRTAGDAAAHRGRGTGGLRRRRRHRARWRGAVQPPGQGHRSGRWLGAAVRGVVPGRRATMMTSRPSHRADHRADHRAGHRDVRPTVAVVGAGISGLTAAYLLSRTHAVTLYEAEPRLGGHAHTHHVTDPGGARLGVDTGFIVHNDRTYPRLRRLFAELGVNARPTEMSMSIHDESTGLQYAGGRGARGVFAQPIRAADPRFWSVLAQVRRFHRRARSFLART